jgi:hypothetical protein
MADLVADRASNRTLCVQLSQDGMRFFCDGSILYGYSFFLLNIYHFTRQLLEGS